MEKLIIILFLILPHIAFSQTRAGTGPSKDEIDSVPISKLLQVLNDNRFLCKIDETRFYDIFDFNAWYLKVRIKNQLQNINDSGAFECSEETHETNKSKMPLEVRCLFDDQAKKALHDLVSPNRSAPSFFTHQSLKEELKKHASANDLNPNIVYRTFKTLIELDKYFRDEEK